MVVLEGVGVEHGVGWDRVRRHCGTTSSMCELWGGCHPTLNCGIVVPVLAVCRIGRSCLTFIVTVRLVRGVPEHCIRSQLTWLAWLFEPLTAKV